MPSNTLNPASIAVDILAPPMGHRKNKNLSSSSLPSQQKQQNNIILVLPKCENLFDDSPKKVEKHVAVLKHLSKQVTFDKKVVEERSPHTIPFSEWNSDKTYDNKLIRKEKKSYDALLQERANEAKTSLPTKKDIQINDIVPKKTSSDTFLIGVDSNISCSDLLISLPSVKSKCNVKREIVVEEKDVNTTQQWEEHVMSKLSRATVNMISKDEKPLVNNKSKISIKNSLVIHKPQQKNRTAILKVNTEKDKATDEKVKTNELFFNDMKKNRKKQKVKLEKKAYPQPPSKWRTKSEYGNAKDSSTQIVYGAKKWTAFPDVDVDNDLVIQQVSDTKLGEKIVWLPGLKDKVETFELIPIFNEWGKKWVYAHNIGNKTLMEIKSEIRHTSEHVRCLGIISAANFISGNYQVVDQNTIKILVNIVSSLLNNDSCLVSFSSALFLFCVNKLSEKAKDILIKNALYGHPSERWAAVQCLAHYKYYESCIIRELISGLTGKDKAKYQTANKLLKELSEFTNSVQYMVAEKLNSENWSHRVAACQILPCLHGTLTKDIANKLTYLFWNDWNKSVQKAALEALGRSGNGKLVHYLLCDHLASSKVDDQVTALKMIGTLGIMTVQLINRLLFCFKSDNDEVCLQSIKLCIRMKLKDDVIIDELVNLLSSNRSIKIKIFILRAFGEIDYTSEVVEESLLWTLNYASDAKLRREACLTVMKLNLYNDQIIKILQEIAYIDEDASVRKESVRALYNIGLQAIGNEHSAKMIQKSIKYLCRRENLIAQVVDGKINKVPEKFEDDEQSSSEGSVVDDDFKEEKEGTLYRYSMI